MSTIRNIAAVVATLALVAACGDDEETADTTTTAAATTTTVIETTTTGGETTTTVPAGLEQPAIWPAADVVFNAPEDAAADFVSQVLGVPPALGDFRWGDSRSGEIDVLSLGDGGVDPTTAPIRGTLFLRQLGPESSWFVIGAGSALATITAPEAMATVPAGPLTVEGEAMGFEATIIITAFVAGDAGAVLDQEVTMAGTMGVAGPYSVTLDLSAASPGDTIGLLVRGSTGLETDPGDFSAIVVTIG